MQIEQAAGAMQIGQAAEALAFVLRLEEQPTKNEGMEAQYDKHAYTCKQREPEKEVACQA